MPVRFAFRRRKGEHHQSWRGLAILFDEDQLRRKPQSTQSRTLRSSVQAVSRGFSTAMSDAHFCEKFTLMVRGAVPTWHASHPALPLVGFMIEEQCARCVPSKWIAGGSPQFGTMRSISRCV